MRGVGCGVCNVGRGVSGVRCGPPHAVIFWACSKPEGLRGGPRAQLAGRCLSAAFETGGKK